MKKELGFCVVGCGKMGVRRINSVVKHKNSRLISIVDADGKRLNEIYRKYKLKCKKFEDYKKAIDDSDVNCVIVCTPNKFHFPVSIFALSKKKHVLCEKPLAMSPKEALKMVKLSEKNGLFLKTGSNHRFFPNVKRAKEFIEKGVIGNINFIYGEIGHKKSLPDWYKKKDLSGGGTIIDNGVHLIDIARWLCGDFKECYGRVHSMSDTEVEDNGFAFLKSKNKNLFLKSSWNKSNGYMKIEILGERGSLVIECDDGKTKLVHFMDGKNKTYDFSHLPFNSFDLDFEEFVKAVLGNRQPLASGDDGLKAVEIVSAIYRSSKNGKVVSI